MVMIVTSRDVYDGVHTNWTTAEIADRIDRGDPEALTEALRPIAARLATQAGGVSDPGSVMLDLSRAVESIAAAVSVIAAGRDLAEKGDPLTAVDALQTASSELYAIHINI